MLDRARGYGELRLKEALSIHMTPAEECFNGDRGLKIPGYWTALMRQEGRNGPH